MLTRPQNKQRLGVREPLITKASSATVHSLPSKQRWRDPAAAGDLWAEVSTKVHRILAVVQAWLEELRVQTIDDPGGDLLSPLDLFGASNSGTVVLAAKNFVKNIVHVR